MVEKPEQIDDLLLSKRRKTLYCVPKRHLITKKIQDLVEKFEKKGYDILVLKNTICNATLERQVEARRIASQVDAMIVIGGKNSSNTETLRDMPKECKELLHFIQSLGDFNPECVNSVRSVRGITAGHPPRIKLLRRFILMSELSF